jgi:hypothetical protein
VTGFGNVSNISNPQISGSHYWGSTNFSLNGVSLNNFGNGSASGTQSFNGDQIGEANLPPPEALQELRVDSGGLSAEYKNVAAVTLILKQGTNNYHGDAYEHVEDDVLNAKLFHVECHGAAETTIQSPPVRRRCWWADQEGPVVLFCFLPGHPREIEPHRQPGAAVAGHAHRRFFGAVLDLSRSTACAATRTGRNCTTHGRGSRLRETRSRRP